MIVLNRPWESAVTPAVLLQTRKSPASPVGILMDPPYRTASRCTGIYRFDQKGVSDDVAAKAYDWSIEHGHKYRIAYCCRQGDFEIPPGWSFITSTLVGIRKPERRRRHRDLVMFSPACIVPNRDFLTVHVHEATSTKRARSSRTAK